MTSTIWQQCLAQLEVELGQQQFETYIRPLQANFDAGQLTLKAPNVYVEKHVRQSYLERIAEFLDSVDEDLERALRESALYGLCFSGVRQI